jgi:4-hydroxy-tetrahydrodipicolinate synthase
MFHGCFVALVTPFTGQGDIDYPALRKLVEFHLRQDSDGLVMAGTTGEAISLTQTEFCEILDRVVEQVSGRIPVIAGTGSASTAHTLEQTRLAAIHGADAALVVTPYYNRPVQRGLEAHFRTVADASEIPLILYNVPSRTSVDILPETVASLSTHERIVGIKEAVADMARVDSLLVLCSGDFAVLSGDDHSCLQAMKHGAHGVISVAANVVPGPIAELCAAARRGEWDLAESTEYRLRKLFDILMIETNPIPVKWALFEMGLLGPHIRLPMTSLGDEFREPLRQCLNELELISA